LSEPSGSTNYNEKMIELHDQNNTVNEKAGACSFATEFLWAAFARRALLIARGAI